MAGGPSGTSAGLNHSSNLFWAFVLSSFAAFGGILFGYDTGTIGGIIAMKDWLQVFGTYGLASENAVQPSYYIATDDKSLVVSILSAGTFFGALLAFPIGDFIGRKWGIITACAIFSLGIGMQLDTKWAVFIVGRVIAGLGVGLVSCLVPMYQSETAPKNIRGLIVGLYQLSITIGALLAAIVLNSTKDKTDHSSWRIPIAIQFVWAGILAGGLYFLPESPRYLLHKNRPDAARVSLGRLMTLSPQDPLVIREAAEISAALEAERAQGQSSYLDCFRPTVNKNLFRTLTGIFLQAWQQLTGINFIFYYGTTFFQQSGISNPFVITIACDVVNTGMTLIGINFIDRIGRRRLLIWGAVGMAVSEFLVAIVGVTAGQPDALGAVNLSAQKVLVAFTCIYIAFFAISWGPVAWVVTGEIFPLAIRAKGMSLSVASNWLWNFGIGYATPYLVDQSTSGPTGIKAAGLGVKVFFIWGATCLGCIVFAYFCIPETKGLSLEQIDLLYRESTILGSSKYRREILAKNETFLNPDGKISDENLEVGKPAHVLE